MKKNKILLLIISFIAASVLWVYVVTVVNPEGTRSISGIPVTFSGEDVLREDQNLIITEGKTMTVTVDFQGRNADLNKLLKQQSEITQSQLRQLCHRAARHAPGRGRGGLQRRDRRGRLPAGKDLARF